MSREDNSKRFDSLASLVNLARVIRIRHYALVFALLMLANCGRPDGELARLCAEIIPALEPSDIRLKLLPAQNIRGHQQSVRIPFTAITPQGEERHRYISCAFEGGGGLSQKRPRLVAVESDEGVMNEAQLYFLLRFWVNSEESVAEGRERLVLDREAGPPQWLAYLVQSLLNTAPWTAILTLLATAYALLYGLSHRINLAFGDLAVIGSYALVTSLGAALVLGGPPALAIVLGFSAALVATSLAARSLGHLVIAPLVNQPGRMLLVASIGVELVVQEGLRISQGAGNQWLRPILATPHILFVGHGFPVHVTTMQIVVAVLALCLALVTLALMRWTRFGLSWRALADDSLAATLCGISPKRVLSQTMIAAGLLSGACGAIIALAYGNAHYALGTTLGLQAIIAAIVGGIGSVSGALMGGVMLGLFSGLWAAYVSIESRDIAVYALLSIVLIVRPGGLMGLAAPAPREV